VIATLRGKVSQVGIETMVVEVGDVGYLVTAPGRLLAEVATIGTDVYLHIHTYVREDQISLYGFKTVEDREFFELLMSVKGIGPKAALGMISQSDVTLLKKAVFQEDKALLATVPGIGIKTAARVILEIRDKLKEEYLSGATADGAEAAGGIRPGVAEGAVRALISLGYRESEVRRVLSTIEISPDTTLEVAVAGALKALGRPISA
jgi:Holliday junction DNA helicase RuvA